MFPAPAYDWIKLFYDGEWVRGDNNNLLSPYGNLTTENTSYTNYEWMVAQNDADRGAYPGTRVSGWVVWQIPADFDRSEAALVIGWGPDDDQKTYYWYLG